MNKPHLILIHPAPDKNRLGSHRRKKSSVAPLTLSLLAGLAEKDFQVTIYDEDIEVLPTNISADIVGITVTTPQAKRAYEIADTFREKNIPVIVGGLHPSFLPEEAARHADVVVIGEAESIWDLLVADWKSGRLESTYRAETRHDLRNLPQSNHAVFKPGAYTYRYSIMASRGCPYGCDYCSVTQYWGNTYRCRPVEEVVQELTMIPGKNIVFVDDNICGNRPYARRLFEAMIPLKKKWIGQGSINLAKDPSLLELAKRSGLKWLFVGFESINPDNLKDMGKHINKVAEYSSLIRTFHDYGVNLLASFILGMDHDNINSFPGTLDFCETNHIDGANFYIYTPFPSTRIFTFMEEQGRLLHKDWSKYDANHVVFQPKNMSPEELMEGYLWLYKSFYSLNSISKRIRWRQPHLVETLALNLGRVWNSKRFVEGCIV